MSLNYKVKLDPHAHLFEVEVRALADAGGRTWVLPVWTPGSYVLREYAGFVTEVRAEAGGHSVPVRKRDKTTWEIADCGEEAVTLRYRVYAHELSVRTSFLDDRHGYINGASLFLYPEAGEHLGGSIQFELPPGWGAHAALPAAGPGALSFHDIDELIDSPIELGQPRTETAVIDGVPHEMVLCGRGPLDLTHMARDLPPLVEAARRVFDRPLPYDRYVFLIHQTGRGGGGLEHRASTSLQFPRFAGDPQEARRRFLGLVAHEYFHLWNVKRIHPVAFGPFDYQHEVYSKDLWLMEGGTDYYAVALLGRAGLVPARDLLDTLASRLHHSESRPGNQVQSLEDASFDAWIKHYRPHAGSLNSTVSYYEKGSLACWLLDLELRRLTHGRASLDHVLRTLWDRYPDGYPEGAPRGVVEEFGGREAADFLEHLVARAEPLNLSPLRAVGLRFVLDGEGTVPDTGLETSGENAPAEVRTVRHESPGERAGIAPGDRLLALDGLELTRGRLSDRLRWYRPGDRLSVHLFRDGELIKRTLELGEVEPDKPRLVAVADPKDVERAAFAAWLGQPYPF